MGDRWDLLPAKGETLDTVIRCLKITEHRDFGLFTLRCHINTSRDRYRNEKDYRLIILNNILEAAMIDQYEY